MKDKSDTIENNEVHLSVADERPEIVALAHDESSYENFVNTNELPSSNFFLSI